MVISTMWGFQGVDTGIVTGVVVVVLPLCGPHQYLVTAFWRGCIWSVLRLELQRFLFPVCFTQCRVCFCLSVLYCLASAVSVWFFLLVVCPFFALCVPFWVPASCCLP